MVNMDLSSVIDCSCLQGSPIFKMMSDEDEWYLYNYLDKLFNVGHHTTHCVLFSPFLI